MNDIKNPFKFGRIVKGDDFCNRVNEIKAINSYISDGYSFWLYSPRRFGKSSLIKKVFMEQRDIKTIYLDLYNIDSLDDFCRKYSKALATNLFNWKTELKSLSGQIGKYFKSLYPKISLDESGIPSFSLEKNEISSQLDMEQILEMPEQYGQEFGTKICIAFDEFQEIERINPFIINWMRSSFQNHNQVSYIFLGSKQTLMNSIFSNMNSPFYEFAIKMDIAPISGEDFTNFIRTKFENAGLTISDNTIESILRKSELHPHFTQYFASVVFDFIRAGADQNEEYFTNKWIERIINSQSIIFQSIYDQLSGNQRRTIVAIACSQADAGLFSEISRKAYKLPPSSSLNIAISALIKKELVYKNGSKYKISNPVFREWIQLLP